jgi:hypothetical protein
MIETSRRSFITGLVSFVAAPAIVRAANIMPVRSPKVLAFTEYYQNRVIRTYLDVQAIRDRNVLLSIEDFASLPRFRNIPISVVDSL